MCRPGSADQIRSSKSPDSPVAIITVWPDRISSPTRLVSRSALRPRRLAGSPSMLTSLSLPSSIRTKPPASAVVSSRRLAAIRSSTASRSRWAFMSATTSPRRRITRARCAIWYFAASSSPSRWQTFTQPSISPSRPVSALMSIRRSIRLPSLQARRVANEIWPPLRTRSSTALCSAWSSSGMIGGSRPSDLTGGPAEHLLGGRVPQQDAAVGAERDNGVGGTLDDRPRRRVYPVLPGRLFQAHHIMVPSRDDPGPSLTNAGVSAPATAARGRRTRRAAPPGRCRWRPHRPGRPGTGPPPRSSPGPPGRRRSGARPGFRCPCRAR